MSHQVDAVSEELALLRAKNKWLEAANARLREMNDLIDAENQRLLSTLLAAEARVSDHSRRMHALAVEMMK